MSVHAPLSPPILSRNTIVAGGVVLFHVAALWAIQSGLLRRAVEVIVPAEIIVELMEPPRVAPPPPPPAPPPPPERKPVVQPRAPTPPPVAQPIAIPDPTPAPTAPTGVIEPPPAPPVVAPAPPAPPAPPAAPPAPPAPPTVVEVTSAEVTYVRPPRPTMPAMSRRLNESGNVVLAVYYDVNGNFKRAEILKSSGFDRLDRAALTAQQDTRVTPFRRPGMTDNQVFMFKAPINFVLE